MASLSGWNRCLHCLVKIKESSVFCSDHHNKFLNLWSFKQKDESQLGDHPASRRVLLPTPSSPRRALLPTPRLPLHTPQTPKLTPAMYHMLMTWLHFVNFQMLIWQFWLLERIIHFPHKLFVPTISYPHQFLRLHQPNKFCLFCTSGCVNDIIYNI